ncbi:MAG: hemolysin III [Candidatus Phytoplasma cynodontis]|nr:MAG: hemolysin III [Candidatus Phytoplasma cynodontis]
MNFNQYKNQTKQTLGEEIANAISHGIMIPFSIFSFFFYYHLLINRQNFNFRNILSLFLFSLTMLILYTTSCLYHSLSSQNWKFKLQKLDHICIYLLIWGSFSPFLLLRRDYIDEENFVFVFSKECIFFLIQTFIVILGILGKFFYFTKWKNIHLFLYLFLGWNGLFFLKDLLLMDYKIILFLLLGGIFYTIGVFFYSKSRIYKYYHFVWHIFVILGNLLHILSVYFLINSI